MEIKEIKVNTLSPSMCAPPLPMVKPQPNDQTNNMMTVENASELLKLVNVGKSVLNISSLNLSSEGLIILAEGIKSARKNNSGVEFENGRIIVPEKLFDSLLKAAKNIHQSGSTASSYHKPNII